MIYTALYRKFRPLTFEEISGQDHITKTLKNQITNNRTGHAYLFCGGRGTGKTSAAKIFARVINCLNPQNGEPCNECEICKEILNNSLTDVVEMDAASNNGVEDIRKICEEVNFLPTKAQYRIYIIDEVHMLSTGAFNALLKTLEEPPKHVKFILATTEPQKLPATILSRCQIFDFKKISEKDIDARLQLIANEVNLKITKESLELIAILSEGAMRDGISILERCMQYDETEITEDKIKELVGIPKLEYIERLVEHIIENNIEKSLQVLDTIIEHGKDLTNFLWEVIKYIRDILLYKTTKNLKIYSENELKTINNLSEKATKEKLLELIYSFSELENNMKWSNQKTILFQITIMKNCKIETVGASIDRPQPQSRPLPSPQPKSTEPSLTEPYATYWETIIHNIKHNGDVMLYANLLSSKAIEIDEKTLEIYFEKEITPFGKTLLNNAENIKKIEAEIKKTLQKNLKIKYSETQIERKAKVQQKSKESIEELAKDLEIPFNIIE